MGAFNKVSKDSIDNIQINAGMILKNFNPTSPTEPTDSDIVCATTGGITAICVPSFEDFGSDIDNCPNNTKELKKITGWECTLAFTAVDVNEDTIKLALGAAGTVGSEVQPKAEVMDAYFSDIWFISERVDNKVVAIKLKNALSTGGLSLKTQKNGKGNLTITLTGHISITDVSTIPMLFYIADVGSARSFALTSSEE